MKRFWTHKGLVLLVLAAVLVGMSGCGWMGRTAGKAQAKVEKGVEALGKGYKDGYEDERGASGEKNKEEQKKPDTAQPSADTPGTAGASSWKTI